MADHHHICVVEPGRPADKRRIVTKTSVAVDFAPVGKDAFDVIEGVGALRMSG